MTFDYARPRATAERLIARFGRTATLRKPGAVTGPANDPTYGAPTDTTITCVDLEQRVRDGATLTDITRRTLIVSTSAGVTPSEGDTVVIDGGEHEALEVRTLAPGGVTVMWEVDIQRG